MEKDVLERLTSDFNIKFRLNLEIKNTTSIKGGCINNSLKLDTNQGLFFLKWNTSGSKDMFIREAESLNEFQKSNNEFIVFPKPLLVKAINHLPGYLLTNYLEPGRTSNDDEKLGWGLAQLHKVTSEYFGFKTNNYCGATLQNNTLKSNWINFYIENRLEYIVNLIRKNREWNSTDEKTYNHFLNRIPELLPHKTFPSLIHGDLWSGNYMYTKHAPALIDPCVSYCDREFEMGIMTMFGGFSQTVYDAYNEAYPLDKEWKERNLIYQLFHILNHYFLFSGHYKNEAISIMKRYS